MMTIYRKRLLKTPAIFPSYILFLFIISTVIKPWNILPILSFILLFSLSSK